MIAVFITIRPKSMIFGSHFDFMQIINNNNNNNNTTFYIAPYEHLKALYKVKTQKSKFKKYIEEN